MIIERDYNVDVSNLSKPNLWSKMTQLRAGFELNDTQHLDESGIWVAFINMPMVLTKRIDIIEGSTRVKNGIAFYDIPSNPSKTPEIKRGGNVILTPDVMLMMTYYKRKAPLDPNSLSPEKLEASKDFGKIGRDIVKDIVSPWIPGTLVYNSNDILIDGNRKFVGVDSHANIYGVFETIPVTLRYKQYESIFEEYLCNDKNHLNSNHLITGVFDEANDITMSKEEFAELMITKIQEKWSTLKE